MVHAAAPNLRPTFTAKRIIHGENNSFCFGKLLQHESENTRAQIVGFPNGTGKEAIENRVMSFRSKEAPELDNSRNRPSPSAEDPSLCKRREI